MEPSRTQLNEALLEVELLIAKASGLSEVAKIATIEKSLRDFLFDTWSSLSKKAIKKVPKNPKTVGAVAKAVKSVMSSFPSKVTKRMNRDITEVYKLARLAGWKKATGQTKSSLQYDTDNFSEGEKGVIEVKKAELKPSFSVVDTQAIDALEKDNVFWVGELYDKNVADGIAEATSTAMIKHGSGTTAAGIAVREALEKQLGAFAVPGGYRGSAKGYFEGLAANAATTARVHGQLQSFAEAEITSCEVVNPSDERTCPVCGHMDGKVFPLETCYKQMADERESEDPEQIKSIHPWMSAPQLKEISPKPGDQGLKDAKALGDAGVANPPYHFRCRCTLDVSMASF